MFREIWKSPAMTCATFVAPLVLLVIVSPAWGQTEPDRSMDEIIADSATSSHQFDLYDASRQNIKMEMDMVFPIEQWREIVRANSTHGHSSRHKRKGIRFGNGGNRWTGDTVPYEIAPGVFDTNERNKIMAALQDWMRYTCITFRPATVADRNKIRFQNGDGCYSNVGMTGGSQKIGLARNCRVKKVIIHEVGHAIGFHHEQTRPDRDNYVRIMHNNIPSAVRFNFHRYTRNVINDRSVPYDYYSIMHYGGKAFSFTGGYTIKTKNSRFQNVIGRQKGLSFRDIKLANKMYSCAAHCRLQDSDCPGEGFVGKDCRCWCPGSPYTLCNGNTGNSPRTTTPSPITTTPVTGVCLDGHEFCSYWASQGYCSGSRYTPHVRSECHRSCHICTDQCADDEGSCGQWASEGYCSGEYSAYVRTHCRRSCSLCTRARRPPTADRRPPTADLRPLTADQRPPTDEESPPTGMCVDRNTMCASWALSNECQTNPGFMNEMCKHSCGVC